MLRQNTDNFSNVEDWQRCSDSHTILPSLHGNVAFLIYNVDKRIIFAAELLKERT